MSGADIFAGLKRHHYRAILGDPPWDFRTWSAKGSGRSAISHYDTISFDKLAALPIAELAASDCALFLWTYDPLLHRAFELIAAWGFTFKTRAFTWAKTTRSGQGFPFGLGYYTRANSEIVLLGTRGKPKVISHSVRELIVATRREHSRKPDETRERIEQLVAGPYLELFARNSSPGWDAWGIETGLFDNGPVSTRRQPSNLTTKRRSAT